MPSISIQAKIIKALDTPVNGFISILNSQFSIALSVYTATHLMRTGAVTKRSRLAPGANSGVRSEGGKGRIFRSALKEMPWPIVTASDLVGNFESRLTVNRGNAILGVLAGISQLRRKLAILQLREIDNPYTTLRRPSRAR